MLFKSDSSDSVNEFLWKDKSHKSRKGATGEDLSDIYKDYSLPSGKHLMNRTNAVRCIHLPSLFVLNIAFSLMVEIGIFQLVQFFL